MARVSKVDACMICDMVPCECNKKPVKKIKPSKPVHEPVVIVSRAPIKSMREAMKATAIARPVEQVIKPPIPKHKKPETPIDDLLWADSIRNLAPILHHDEVEKYKVLITSIPSTSERTAIWKARRLDGGENEITYVRY